MFGCWPTLQLRWRSPPAPAMAVEIPRDRTKTIDKVPVKVAVYASPRDRHPDPTRRPAGAGVPDKLFVPRQPMSPKAPRSSAPVQPGSEGVNAFAPDLVIVGGRSSTQVEATSRVAPTIDMTMAGDDLVAQARARLAA